jgi:hypothetical protein
MNETPAVISIETPFYFVKQVYVLPNLVIYFFYTILSREISVTNVVSFKWIDFSCLSSALR